MNNKKHNEDKDRIVNKLLKSALIFMIHNQTMYGETT